MSQTPNEILDATLERILWPKEQRADDAKLIAFAEEISDAKTTLKILDKPAPPEALRDLPEDALDGYLGELCSRYISRAPRSYAYLAIVTVGSALVPRADGVRVNLFTGLVGPVHSGKSQSAELAQKLLGIAPPQLLDVMAGSAEALIRKCSDAAGNPRLFSPDELGHLLEKAQIQNASFPYILNRAFYSDCFEVLMARGHAATFNASLSILGGLTEERFADLFGLSTTAGLWDRFIFGACPGGFVFDYRPFNDVIEHRTPKPVSIDGDVWEAKQHWLADCPELGARVAELAIRVATICASFDGRERLRAADLGPARQFADYQMRIRRILRPNAGENFEGRCALKILDYLEQFGGKFVSKRTMFRAVHANRLGPSTADRALSALHANGEVDVQKVGREILVRLIPDVEPGGEGE
jgi:hypothetical protein